MKVLELRRSSHQWFWLAALLVGLYGLGRESNAQERQGPLLGKKAPDFHVQGIFNESYSLETFKGHILVMQFGTSW